LGLSPGEKRDLVAFLRSLTGTISEGIPQKAVGLALRQRRVVLGCREELPHIELEGGGCAGGMPDETVLDQRGPLIGRMPDLEGPSVIIDGPVLRHIVSLKRASFRNPVMPRG